MSQKLTKKEKRQQRGIQFTMKFSLLPFVLLCLEASSASPPQRIRSADRDTARAPARKATATTSGVPLGVGPKQESRRRLLQVGFDYYSRSYGSELVGSMPLSYKFSMAYPTVVDPSDLETIEDEDGEIITNDGHRRCILGTDTNKHHTLKLSYYYKVETVSYQEPGWVPFEWSLIDLVAREQILVAADSSPDDIVYATCG